MKVIQLLHNPSAGEEDHSANELISLLENNGFRCRYYSTKNRRWIREIDMKNPILIAGGDGTVRKVAKELLKRKNETPVLSVLPEGTANNISKSFGLTGDRKKLVKELLKARIEDFDAGIISFPYKNSFFMESFGVGVFPELVRDMAKKNKRLKNVTQEKRNEFILNELKILLKHSKPFPCEIYIDDKKYTGSYLMIEIMNTKSFGPNLFLAPDADPGDGLFDIVMIDKIQLKKLEKYIDNKKRGLEKRSGIKTVRGEKVLLKCTGKTFHADDDLIKFSDGRSIKITCSKGRFKMLRSSAKSKI
jgi:diacylglycerol kinase (ATP)